ncbi:STAS domain-containing protein [Streptomyces sp. SP2-10]|uniref:STAS domain-containing protein n=1 Tax=Streptomyces sp. SP2-10 TaxID=2873385 RepID=UPI00223C3B0F|nr:STAS domain-containing protein [Streptomyces sp. SP2-10]
MGIQRNGASVLAHMGGHLTDEAGVHLHAALDHLTGDGRDLMVDVHGVQAMDADGLLHLLDLHRRAEQRGLRVLVIGWQEQHQQLMANIAGIPGRGPATGERFAPGRLPPLDRATGPPGTGCDRLRGGMAPPDMAVGRRRR